MIRHVVLMKVRSDVPKATLEAVLAELAALKKVVPGMIGMSAGADVSPEGMARGYTHGFTMDFADEAARDAYLVHPDHVRAGGHLCETTEGGRDGVLVMDLVV